MRYITIIAAMILLANACKKADITAPTIDDFKVNDQTVEADVNAGSAMHVEIKASDDRELKELKFDIHDAFDRHGHGKVNNFTRFFYQDVIALSGTNYSDLIDIAVPEDASAGPYHFIARVIDAEGNEGEFAEIELLISNGTEASINVTSPDFTNEVHIVKGNELVLQGTITDDTGLDEIVIIIEEGNDHGKTAEDPLYKADFDLGGSVTTWDFSKIKQAGKDIIIPASAETGQYTLEIVVTDVDGNMSLFHVELHVMD